MIYAKLSDVTAGYPSDQEDIKVLRDDRYYLVTEIDMGCSSTRFKILGFSTRFNSVNFDFYKLSADEESMVEHDIYNDPDYNPWLRYD